MLAGATWLEADPGQGNGVGKGPEGVAGMLENRDVEEGGCGGKCKHQGPVASREPQGATQGFRAEKHGGVQGPVSRASFNENVLEVVSRDSGTAQRLWAVPCPDGEVIEWTAEGRGGQGKEVGIG